MEYVLERHVFHCTPAQLRTIDPRDILTTLTILGVEADVAKAQWAMTGPPARGKKR